MSDARPESQAQTSYRHQPIVFGYRMGPLGNTGILEIRFFVMGKQKISVGVMQNEIDALISQIDAALSEGEEFFTAPNGRRFQIAANLLRDLRKDFSERLYMDVGGSGSNLAVPNMARVASAKTEPARLMPFGARQFNPNGRELSPAKSSAVSSSADGVTLTPRAECRGLRSSVPVPHPLNSNQG